MPLTNRFGLLTASESTRTKVNRGCGFFVGILADEDAACCRRGPQRGGVTGRAAEGSHAIAAGTVRAEALTDQLPCRARISERGPIAAGNVKDPGEFVTIRAEGADALDTHALRLGSPYVSSARIHGGTDGWIGNDGEIELGRLGIDEKAVSNPVPVGHVAAAEVHINLGASISVEAEVRVRDVKSGQAAVAKDGLRPLLRVSSRFPRAVVLRSSLNIVDVVRIHREALELQSPKSLVHAD